ncbi:NAD(P)-binding domain-containing protein [Acuticoccus sp. M5D2P5]|uniref:NAD(P)-dependent oxidoreductase n=1 Tax=Acuticoccus kalidii TaxID=2910977 RepID=UPI001F36FEB8|nr:NAD(P)-dependent oxidoreductase [Acuticoccus kalidii]MCF3935251.1 NAD(P)-binding domain-containing protein [Acuticoccus kalidii]
MTRRLLLGAAWPPALVDRLRTLLGGWDILLWSEASEAERKTADAVVPAAAKVDRALLEGSSIRLVHQFGVGLDTVDLAAAKDLGVMVANAPSNLSGGAAAVAEGAVLLVLMCARLRPQQARFIAEQRWNWQVPLNQGLAGRTVGLVGFGNIGREIAQRLKAFDMTVHAVRRSGDPDGEAAALGLASLGTMDDLNEMLAVSDVVVICAPLNAGTRNLFDARALARMKPEASLVNVGRGGIVDEAALVAALDAGTLHAAGLDTVAAEPLPLDSPLLSHDRIVVTPHDAGVSDVAFDGIAAILKENLRRMEAGEDLLHRAA